ncbi:MAG TPA: carbamoyltransferase HypF [Myxococcaceae bacterium]|nr:carbamoyltransferase HypF [Myxococcaceae bacterium]
MGPIERRAIGISGIVQGVGFRPHVHQLATRLGLSGFVRNRMGAVEIEIEGDRAALDEFASGLVEKAPPLAAIDQLRSAALPARGERGFSIHDSVGEGSGEVFVSPDVATCDDCLRELFDPADRRHRYPFINCTHCGPRLTITAAVPYDRARTTMAGFPLCGACRAEYEDPRDRRFHAQPVACPACGPRLSLRGAVEDGEPLRVAVRALEEGRVVAIKGLGGYHLACDGTNEAAVAALRQRKGRLAKPFAVMVADLAGAAMLGELSAESAARLSGPARPIALLPSRGGVAPSVAPGVAWLGVMLPYTPLHHLLLRELEGRPLVMTSGNRSDEPIAYEDEAALRQLRGVADLFLTHDRPIHIRCDDSVVRGPILLRRSRGYAPAPVRLPSSLARPTLAVGGQLKCTIALGSGGTAFVSHHLGDLEYFEAFRAFTAAIEHYQRLYRLRPERVVYDLHPDYTSTRHAQEMGVEVLGVQHHHAHVASCLADAGHEGPAIGVAFDGAGYSTDGSVWGGEFLVGTCARVERAAHLRRVPLPGGDQAAREPWRMAAAHLVDAGVDPAPLAGRIPPERRPLLDAIAAGRLRAPLTSSAGRLFDAVAFLAGGPAAMSYEAQAAMWLEGLARGPAEPYDFELVAGDAVASARAAAPIPGAARTAGAPASAGAVEIDTRPLIRGVWEDARRGRAAELIASRFHAALARVVAATCERLAGPRDVALTGGVFCNAALLEASTRELEARGFRPLVHRRVPANDGGLSLGQLAVAAALDAEQGRTT